jgi:hypothetical protein
MSDGGGLRPSDGDVARSDAGAPASAGRGLALHSFGERLIGAIRLDSATYAEVHRDESALGQAAGVVALGALAQAASAFQQGELVSLGLMRGALAGMEFISAFAGWFLAAFTIWIVGVKIMKRPSDLRGLLRALGFAAAPQLLYVASSLGLGWFDWAIWLGIWIWTMAAFVTALQAALEVSSGMATVVCLGAALLSLLPFAVAALVGFELLRSFAG